MDITEPEHVQVDSEEDLVEVKSSDTMNKKGVKNKGLLSKKMKKPGY